MQNNPTWTIVTLYLYSDEIKMVKESIKEKDVINHAEYKTEQGIEPVVFIGKYKKWQRKIGIERRGWSDWKTRVHD